MSRLPAKIGLLAIVGVLVLAPLSTLVGEVIAGDERSISEVATSALNAPGAAESLVNTIGFAAGATAFALAIGGSLAYLHVMVDIPFRRLLVVAAVTPLAVPGFLYAFAWILLLSPRSGVLGPALESAGLARFVDPFSLTGMMWIEGLHVSTLAFLLVGVALRAQDADLAEAARLCGASRFQVMRRVTIPIARPALVATSLIVGLRAIEAFEVPGVLGLPARVPVITTRVFALHTSFPADTRAASFLSLLLVGAAVLGLVVSRRSLRLSDRFVALSGQRRESVRVPVDHPRLLGLGIVVWTSVVAVAPVAVLAWASLLPFFRPPSSAAMRSANLDNFRTLLSDADFAAVLQRTLLLGAITSTVVVAVGLAVVRWSARERSSRFAAVADGLTLVPLAMPGLVLGLGIALVWIDVNLPVYGTVLLLVIGFVTAALPYGARYAEVALRPVSVEIEESARIAGAKEWTRLRRLILPLVKPGVVAAWFTVLLLTIRELSSALLLYSPGDEVLAVVMWERFEGGRFSEVAALGMIMLAALAVVAVLAWLPTRAARKRPA